MLLVKQQLLEGLVVRNHSNKLYTTFGSSCIGDQRKTSKTISYIDLCLYFKLSVLTV